MSTQQPVGYTHTVGNEGEVIGFPKSSVSITINPNEWVTNWNDGGEALMNTVAACIRGCLNDLGDGEYEVHWYRSPDIKKNPLCNFGRFHVVKAAKSEYL